VEDALEQDQSDLLFSSLRDLRTLLLWSAAAAVAAVAAVAPPTTSLLTVIAVVAVPHATDDIGGSNWNTLVVDGSETAWLAMAVEMGCSGCSSEPLVVA